MSESVTHPSAQPSTVRWRILAILLAYSLLSWFNRVSISVAYDEQIKHLGISKEAIGGVYSAFFLAYMLCMTPGGWLADRRGAHLALVLMGWGSALFVALTGMVGLVAQTAIGLLSLLYVVRMLMGVFTAPIYPSTARLIAHWFPPGQRAGANGAITSAALVGSACTFFGFGLLIDRFGWPTAFMIAGTITAFIALLWTWYGRTRPTDHPGVNTAELGLIGEPPPGQQPTPGTPWRALLSNQSLLLLTISYAAVGYFEYLFYFWTRSYFNDILEVDPHDSRLYATILNLSMAVGMLLGGWLSDRLERRHGKRIGRTAVVVGGMLIGGVLLGVGVRLTELVWIIICFGVAMAAVGATEGPFWTTAIELGGRQGATAAGIFNTGGNIGGMIAPALTPVVGEWLGWDWALSLGGGACLMGAVLWWWIDPSEGERQTS